jgi:3,4-dihydroxy 2-butanone 4-phosphate synthase/GTP cyclohydrolase II
MLRVFLRRNERVPRPEQLSSIDEIIDDARNGRMFILVDDEDRENEGDIVVPAQMATPKAINFMAKYGRGLICLSLGHQRIKQLNLPAMARRNTSRHETAFTVSIEAREGVTTGISASDRARTVAVPSIRRKAVTISSHRATCFRSRPATAACLSARGIPRRLSISRDWRG